MATRKREFNDVRLLPSGRWQGRYRAPDGRRVSLPQTYASEREAHKAVAAAKHEVAEGSWLDPAAGAETLESFALKVLEIRAAQLAPRTVAEARRNLTKHVLPELGRLRVSKVTPMVVDLWYTRAKATLGDVALRNSYFALSGTMRFAVRYGLLRENPCQVQGAARDASRPRPDHDLDDLVRVVDVLPQDLRPVLWLMFGAHLRIGELCALLRSDLDLDRGTLTIERQVQRVDGALLVRETKSHERRVVALAPPILALMNTYVMEHPMLPSAPLFRGPKGGALRREYLQQRFVIARQEAGIEDFHLHDLRHMSLTAFAQAGATAKELMRRGGHRSMASAMRYQHAADERDRQVAELAAAGLPADLRELSPALKA